MTLSNQDLTAKQIVTSHDSIFVEVSLNRLIKATQALIEVKHCRFQSNLYEQIISQKDSAFNKLLYAQKLNREVNTKNEAIIQAQSTQIKKCDEYRGIIEEQNKKLIVKDGMLKIGMPILGLGIGAAGFVIGYYVNQLTK